NPSRLRYVTTAELGRVMDAAPSLEWRLVFALARFAGLRIPSELANLSWDSVDWNARRLTIPSPQLARSESGGIRFVPIMPEVMPYLEAAYKAPDRGQLVCPELSQIRSGNLRTPARRMIERAGMIAWERTFQNLRSSYVIDLHERFPAHVAAAWAG